MDHLDQWLRLYNSQNPVVQERATAGLVRWLPDLVQSTDPRVAPVLLDAFVRHGRFRGPFLEAVMAHPNGIFVASMIALLTHPDKWVRESACLMLGALQDRQATPALIGCLEDPDAVVRSAAAYALAWLKDPAAAPALLAQYERHPVDDNFSWHLEMALHALGVSYTRHPRWGVNPSTGETSAP